MRICVVGAGLFELKEIPHGDNSYGWGPTILATVVSFAVGFLVRPIGAWLMGIYADHNGRKAGLMLSVSLMCVGSLMIAAAPTYAQAGLLSPATLLVAPLAEALKSSVPVVALVQEVDRLRERPGPRPGRSRPALPPPTAH